jgi:polyisoprenoid-binding protein YceI
MTMTAGTPAKPDLIAQLEAGDLAGEWALDATRSQARIATRSIFGAVPVKGTFTALTGDATVSDQGEARGRLTIGTASLDTGNARRDTHLKSASFLDAANHPTIEFTLSRIDTGTGSVGAVGTLTVRETTRPVTVPLEVELLPGGQLRVTGAVTIDRSEYGAGRSLAGLVSVKTRAAVTAVFTRR